MRLLLDESIPRGLRNALSTHSVLTVAEMGWSGTKNGRLLALASDHFDAFVTVDKNLEYQQNLEKLPIAIIVLDAPSNELKALLPMAEDLESALAILQPRTLTRIRQRN